MAYLHPDVYLKGLNELYASGNTIHICKTEPTTYADATTTLGTSTGCSLGFSTVTVDAPTVRVGGGYEVTVNAVTEGTITATDTVNYYALVDTTTSRLLAVQQLTNPQVVTVDNVFTLSSYKIGIPAPA